MTIYISLIAINKLNSQIKLKANQKVVILITETYSIFYKS